MSSVVANKSSHQVSGMYRKKYILTPSGLRKFCLILNPIPTPQTGIGRYKRDSREMKMNSRAIMLSAGEAGNCLAGRIGVVLALHCWELTKSGAPADAAVLPTRGVGEDLRVPHVAAASLHWCGRGRTPYSHRFPAGGVPFHFPSATERWRAESGGVSGANDT